MKVIQGMVSLQIKTKNAAQQSCKVNCHILSSLCKLHFDIGSQLSAGSVNTIINITLNHKHYRRHKLLIYISYCLLFQELSCFKNGSRLVTMTMTYIILETKLPVRRPNFTSLLTNCHCGTSISIAGF